MRVTPKAVVAMVAVFMISWLTAAFADQQLNTKPGSDKKAGSGSAKRSAEWTELFNGKDLTGWKVVENPASVWVENGELVTRGDRAHAFYVGEVGGADFKNFELKFEVLTKPNANSGVFFHTAVQEEGWPSKGYEVQVNNSHVDTIRTGSLYGVVKISEAPAQDNQWFTVHLTVKDKHITATVDDKPILDYTEPAEPEVTPDRPDRKLSHGTIALQAHDPGSEVRYRSVKIRLLD